MTVFDYGRKRITQCAAVPDDRGEGPLFILCRAAEAPRLHDAFGFDQSTVLECTDLDESVRYMSFDGYDFVSLTHMEMLESGLLLREINLYISARFLVLVLPTHDSPRLGNLEEAIVAAADLSDTREGRIARLYYMILHELLVDFSDTLEAMEDGMEALSEGISHKVDRGQIAAIGRYRKMAYNAKKQLRALSYVGAQIVMDENNLVAKKYARYFHNVDTRIRKLYDFSESLYVLSGELHYVYDSKWSVKTNDTINKLTVLTLFFGPLTVITGLYGMNFDFMPGLHHPLGYPAALLIMAAVTGVLYFILKKLKWI